MLIYDTDNYKYADENISDIIPLGTVKEAQPSAQPSSSSSSSLRKRSSLTNNNKKFLQSLRLHLKK